VSLAYWADLAGHAAVDDDRGSFRPYSFKERVSLGGLGIAKAAVVNLVEGHLTAILNKAEEPDASETVRRLRDTLILLQDPLAAEIMRAFIKDVHAYFHDGIREPIKDRLRAELDSIPRGTPVALISHSMGTVIALDVLMSDRRRVDWWLTLGSPLGFDAVRAKLAFPPEEYELLSERTPRWDNLFDPIDVVSFDSDLADDLPNGAPNDLSIRNEFVTAEGKRNHHSLYGFLAHPETGALVSAFLEATHE
jgi:hypothetical protein